MVTHSTRHPIAPVSLRHKGGQSDVPVISAEHSNTSINYCLAAEIDTMVLLSQEVLLLFKSINEAYITLDVQSVSQSFIYKLYSHEIHVGHVR